ncbi:MAG: hypothetical protein V7604_5137 [Hyphomicrobiales bacterium]|jgi:hypothetical protein
MIKLFMSGAWVCLITLAAAYGISQWVASGGKLMVRKDYLEGLEYEKTRMINVPMIVDGAVQGYIAAQFVFTVDAKTVRQLSVPPDPFVVHEAFRRIYSEERIDFKNLKKQDLVPLLKGIKQDVNERMQANIVQDVLIEEFNYISKDDLRK